MATLTFDADEFRPLVQEVVAQVVKSLDDSLVTKHVTAAVLMSIKSLLAFRSSTPADAVERSIGPAGEKWGYQFGIDGLMSVNDAEAWLSVSDKTLDRMTVDGAIRKGKHKTGIRCFCRRSVEQYASSREE